MRTTFIKWGDGYAVRIPKSLVEQANLPKSFNVVAAHGGIVLRRYKRQRYGWRTSIRKAIHEHGNELSPEETEWMNAPLAPIESPRTRSNPRKQKRQPPQR